eukprot:g5035.t1
MDLNPVVQKAHSKSKVGAKANKRKAYLDKKSGKVRTENEKRQNHKAFGVANYGRVHRTIQRNNDLKHRTEVKAATDRNNAEGKLKPPIVVTVMGPAGCGKTTLVKSLVKKWTNQTLTTVNGPINVVTGKKRRVTLYECPSNDTNAMIDLAKISDLVLLMIDASFGFEMETFEFLNVLQVHGFPKVLGVLTHLDKFRMSKRLQKTKKKLKSRFWTEIYEGAKLFYLSGLINGRYPKNEVHNLCLFISRIKFRPLTWRNTHPYVLVDRFEDITPSGEVEKDETCSRTMTMYGFVRGTNLKPGMKVHIPGAGDFYMKSLALMPDPCPLPEKSKDGKQRRKLGEKDVLIYAPQSNMGAVMYDADAVYIDLPKVHFSSKKDVVNEENEEEKMEESSSESDDENVAEGISLMKQLQKSGDDLSGKMQKSTISLIAGGVQVGEDDSSDDDSDSSDDDSDSSDDEETDVVEKATLSRKEKRIARAKAHNEEKKKLRDQLAALNDAVDAMESEEEGEEEDRGAEPLIPWRNALADSSAAQYLDRVSSGKLDLMKLVYGEVEDLSAFQEKKALIDVSDSDSDSDDDEFFSLKNKKKETKQDDDVTKSYLNVDSFDCCRFSIREGNFQDWNDVSVRESIRDKFVTGKWKDPNESDDDDDDVGSDSDAEVGDWEDLEADARKTIARIKEGRNEEEEESGGFEDLEGEEITYEMEEENNEEEEESSEEEEEEEKITTGGADISWRDERDRRRAEKAELLRAEKQKKKDAFDAAYDKAVDSDGNEEGAEVLDAFARAMKTSTEMQAKLNAEEFADESEETRLMLEGFRAGMYVRIELEGMPCEFVKHYKPNSPVLIGGLLPAETALGLLQIRCKAHRWSNKRLKCNNPLIFSIGWRRFQSLPLLSMKDPNLRNRMLKYTPEHLHCTATFYGPLVPPNTGVLCVQSVDDEARSKGFGIAATGVVLEVDRSFQVQKKLKLTGTPYKIFKKTAFIKDMFTSDLEVAKFVGAKLKTVSGIRGMVKKAIGSKGCFRATFEDKIIMSDIVFLNTWAEVKPKQLYNPICNHLVSRIQRRREVKEDGTLEEDDDNFENPEEAAVEAKSGVQLLMRTSGQIRHDRNLAIKINPDSLYGEVERKERRFNTLKIPKSLQSKLPFASKPKVAQPLSAKALARKRKKKKGTVEKLRRAVMFDKQEKKEAILMQQLKTLAKDTKAKRKKIQERKSKEHRKKEERENRQRNVVNKMKRKLKFQREGIEQAKRMKRMESR